MVPAVPSPDFLVRPISGLTPEFADRYAVTRTALARLLG
jgi:hypothetical protein